MVNKLGKANTKQNKIKQKQNKKHSKVKKNTWNKY